MGGLCFKHLSVNIVELFSFHLCSDVQTDMLILISDKRITKGRDRKDINSEFN